MSGSSESIMTGCQEGWFFKFKELGNQRGLGVIPTSLGTPSLGADWFTHLNVFLIGPHLQGIYENF